jgi:predicted RNase H-like nuclease
MPPALAPVVGVDGWRGSWVAAHVDADGVRWSVGRLADLVDADVAVVAVDMPVRLVASGRRRCDLAGRAFLGAAASRLFVVPPAPAYAEPDLATANGWLRASGEAGVSAQAYALRAAVHEVGVLAAADPRVVEVHPELSFAALGGRVLAPKRTARGVAERLDVLAGWCDPVALLRTAPPQVPADDALDALAAAWTAERVRDGVALAYPVDAGAGEPVIRA